MLQQRTIEERLRREFETQLDDAHRTLVDWGGWYSLHLFLFDDGVESSRTLRRHDLRLWGRAVLDDGAHEFYARTRLSLIDFNSGDAYDGNDDDVEGPNLERGIYRFNLARALQASHGRIIDGNLIITAGRDLVTFGQGLALSTPLDHVAIQGLWQDWQFTALVGRTVRSITDVDLSRTAKRTRRDFYGTEIRYRGFERHEPFAYVLWQRDRNREARVTPYQRFDYDSMYAGLGSTGELLPSLRYLVEGVYETGHSHAHGQYFRRNRIEAWALRTELEYLFPSATTPRASIEYLFGSGDGDRTLSPTNTIAGNVGDRRDTSFVGFGYADTGLSFAPRYSNLHLLRVGASFFPWPESPRLRRLELGTDWYVFHKHHRDGAVSDPTADLRSGYLGWEMDYFLNWRVDADLAWTARFGAFFPGKAFDDRTTRTFLLVGLTWSF